MSTAKTPEEKPAPTPAPKPEVAEVAKPAKRTPGVPQTHQVSITAAGFDPAALDIKAGDSVCWTNNDDSKHSVKFLSAPAPKPEKPTAPLAGEKLEPVAAKKLPEHPHDKHHGHEHGTVTTADALPAVSGRISQGKTFEKLFDTVGTFAYCCESEPAMGGSVTVS